MHSDDLNLEKGQKIPIVKAIIVQYNIIATKNQVVKGFLKIFEFFSNRLINFRRRIWKNITFKAPFRKRERSYGKTDGKNRRAVRKTCFI